MPYKKDDIERRVRAIDGVRSVENRIQALPVSQFDDELRFRIARAIYGNSAFWNYAAMANPPIHIIVNGGRVTLQGVVQSNVERQLARSLASGFAAFEVRNELKTDDEVQSVTGTESGVLGNVGYGPFGYRPVPR
jgi:hyperosmotically inducible protein